MSFQYDFTQLQTTKELIRFLGVPDEIFNLVLSFNPYPKPDGEFPDGTIQVVNVFPFLRHEIPKKNWQRGYRIVWEPLAVKSEYKALARRLSSFFSFKFPNFPHHRAFGFIGGRNIRENAKDHCGHKHLICVDLKDFFPSIKSARIAALLESLDVTTEVSDSLSRFVTIGESLPLGLPTSPTIANAICLRMDSDLAALAQKYGATYSRYADDLSFSSDGPLPTKEDIAACIRKHEFEIEESKTRTSTIGQAHYVTGLSVSDSTQPHVPRAKKRRLRQEIYYAEKYGLDDHFRHLGINAPHIIQSEINRLDGLVKFVAHHEPMLAPHLKPTWTKILQKSDRRPSFKPKNQNRSPFFIYVDEAEYVRPDGVRLLALAMCVSQHQLQIDQATQEILEATLSDPWAAGNRNAIKRKGLHFTDATEDLRLAYVERMRSLPFEGYVAMSRLPCADDYETTYLRLLNAMIKRRLMAAESQYAFFAFEQNNKVKQALIKQAVMGTYNALKKSNNRHPEHCKVAFTQKPSLGMSVPDFLLGVLGKYCGATGPAEKGKPIPRDILLFERIRDKYRLILDADKWIEYSRRRPIMPW